MQFGPLTLKRCRYGWMLFSGPYIGKCFELYGEYSESEVALMRALVRPRHVVVDVGANIGDLTLPLAQMVGPEGRVHAIESHPDNFNVLCANLALNQMTNVNPINAFVRKSETAEVRPHFVRAGTEPQIVAIDDLGLTRCDFIKIDVDGNELDVLLSAEATLTRFRPVLYLENDVREKSRPLLAFLLQERYALYWHLAPIFSANNFFGNPTNHWAPPNIVSYMVLAIPEERGLPVSGLKRIESAEDWCS